MAKAKKSTTNSSLKKQASQLKQAPIKPPLAAAIDLSSTQVDISEPIENVPSYEPDYMPLRSRWHRPISMSLAVAAVMILLVSGFSLVYAGKVYPGVTANGVYLGGLTKAQSAAALNVRLDEYGRQLIPVSYSGTTLRLSSENLGTSYDSERAADLALGYGRNGSLADKLRAWLRALAGRATNIAAYKYDYAKLTPYLNQISAEVDQPVKNASFTFDQDSAVIDPAAAGKRLDTGRLTLLIQDRLANTSADNVDAPIYDLAPAITTDTLQAAKDDADRYLDGPLVLELINSNAIVNPTDIIGWIKVVNLTPLVFDGQFKLSQLYPLPARVSVEIDRSKVATYVADLAKKVDQPGQDAALTITDGKATVFRPSRDGVELNQPDAVNQIMSALELPRDERLLALDIKVKKPDVTEDNLNDLGIKELLAEGYSTFPGSSADRITNVRLGAARYNGVLLKPDEIFSFGALLGDVGPAQGYRPALVIIGNKQEKQYGGGLCQVSSTAFRAALNAGLPIVERVNHSFAVDYYTQPYGVPGVDATIYYPQVDFKFKNDTGHYILIQTIMEGTTLRFHFYGTKTKEGKIRGPQFISGSLDATKPSHTVFYRDILVDGKVTKTDVFNTHYKSNKEFTIVENQFY